MGATKENQDLDRPVTVSASMGEVMEIIKQQIRKEWRAVKAGATKVDRPLNIWMYSNPGAGKTFQMQALEDDPELNIQVYSISGDSLQQGELGGVLIPVEEDDPKSKVKIRKAVKLAMEGMMPIPPATEEEANDPEFPYNKPGIIFIDEITSIPYEVRSELLTICGGTVFRRKDRKGNQMYPIVPPSFFIVAAGNPPKTVSEFNTQMNFGYNVTTRFAVFHVKAEFEESKNYILSRRNGAYKEQGWHPLVTAFLTENSQYYHPDIPERILQNNMGAQIPNPRTWETVSDYLRELDEEVKTGLITKDIYDRSLTLVVKSKLGAVGDKFLTFADYKNDIIPVEELILKEFSKSPSKYKSYQSKDLNVIRLSVYSALSYLGGKKGLEGKAKETAYTLLLLNTDWLFPMGSEEFLTGILEQCLTACPEIDTMKLPKAFQKSAVLSSRYNL